MNNELLIKGVKRCVLSLPLMFIGPSVIHNAWINKQNWVHYIVLTLGLLISFFAVYLLWKGIMTMMKAMFENE